MKEKHFNMILKSELEKVFDKIEWSFIKDTLLFFDIPENPTKMIMSCVTTLFISVLVNGAKTNFFKP